MKSLILIILFLPNIVLAQVINIKGVVKNADTKETIPYVNIGIFEKAIGTVSNVDGHFEISIDDEYSGDKLSFSHINFEENHIIINYEMADPLSIYLKPKHHKFPEVVVYGRKQYIIGEIGRSDNENSPKGFFKAKGLGGEGATLIYNSGACKINTFNMNVLENSFKELTFKLNFYSLKSKKPYKKIAPETIFKILENQNGKLSINLENENIKINGNFIASIELINIDNSENDSPEFYFSAYQGKKAIAYRRLIGMDKWERIKKVGLCFWMEIEK